MSGQLHALAALPPDKQPKVLIRWEAGWASEPVWMLWRRENSLTLAENRTLDFRLVAISTELSRVLGISLTDHKRGKDSGRF
jgi:hypothetical protein